MRTIIAGGRNVRDKRYISDAINASKFPITEIISGNANGVDKLGEEYAKKADIDLVIFPANWGKHGRAAGPIRNKRMAEYVIEDSSRPGGLIAIWDGVSRGTKNMINTANRLGLKVFIFRID